MHLLGRVVFLTQENNELLEVIISLYQGYMTLRIRQAN